MGAVNRETSAWKHELPEVAHCTAPKKRCGFLFENLKRLYYKNKIQNGEVT